MKGITPREPSLEEPGLSESASEAADAHSYLSLQMGKNMRVCSCTRNSCPTLGINAEKLKVINVRTIF